MKTITIPLSNWADAELARLAKLTASAAIAALDGATLLGERAMLNGFDIPGRISAGGGCRLLSTRDGWIALNLARPDDRALLPALFGDAGIDAGDDAALARSVALASEAKLVEQGRALGLAIAGVGEETAGSSVIPGTSGPQRTPTRSRAQLVVDLSALWAGPLAGHLLWLAGAEVLKVESRNRPDRMRDGDPALFARLNQGKASVAVDLQSADDRDALIALIRRADIVIEAARPRALLQLGIDADQLVRETPGLVWVSITGHGAGGDAANWTGFGDDCGVAAGLSAALFEASGHMGFVGDAIADPLTGIRAARCAWEQWQSGAAARLILSMRGTVAEALANERRRDPVALSEQLRQWAASSGLPFPAVVDRIATTPHPFGSDTAQWIGASLPC